MENNVTPQTDKCTHYVSLHRSRWKHAKRLSESVVQVLDAHHIVIGRCVLKIKFRFYFLCLPITQ